MKNVGRACAGFLLLASLSGTVAEEADQAETVLLYRCDSLEKGAVMDAGSNGLDGRAVGGVKLVEGKVGKGFQNSPL